MIPIPWLMLLLLLQTPAAAQEPPACVTRFVGGEEGASPSVPAPTIEPTHGGAGTRMTVRGTGAPPGSPITIIGLYGEGDCGIAGLGDQLLGTVTADEGGRFQLLATWPATFSPLFGRGASGPHDLPAGRYYIIAFACAPERCTGTGASAPGGPFRLGGPEPAAPIDPTPSGARDDDPGVAAAVVGGVVILLGTLLVVRRLVSSR